MKRVCVFAGSNFGTNEKYRECARDLGRVIADEGLELVYGGSISGLMGEVANEVLARGGTVIGVMPVGLFNQEIVHTKLTRLIEVKDMHERKATMNQLSDGFIALPGGFGTYEELFEVISWAQIGIHNKPIGVLNAEAYYAPLIEMVEHTIQAGFVKSDNRGLLLANSDPGLLVTQMQAYEAPVLSNKLNPHQA